MRADFEKGTKICSRCRKELPISCFYKNKSESDGLSSYCKECGRIATKQWYRDNVYDGSGKYRNYITKWWKGEIRHWTVNDGIWRE